MPPVKPGAPLKLNTLINDTWLVTKGIAAGGFGKVFMLTNTRSRTRAAAKIQTGGKSKEGVSELLWEVYVMVAFRGSRHCPRLIAYMEDERMDMIIMELLGPTLRDVEVKMNRKPMHPGYAALIGRQCLSAVRDLHNCSFIHRDVKPENFAFGMGDKCRRIYLIDFGMSKRYRLKNGRLLPERRTGGFRGTILYASERAHRREELGMADDLTSLFYVIVEMFAGSLPWHRENVANKVQQMKAEYSLSELDDSIWRQMKEFADYIATLRYDDRPDYRKLDKLLAVIMLEHGVKPSTRISWQHLLDESLKRSTEKE